MNVRDLGAIRRRLGQIASAIVAAGAIAALAVSGARAPESLVVGGAIAAANLAMVGTTAEGLLLEHPNRYKYRVLGGFFLRLVLILAALHVMIRLHCLHAPAAVIGFARF